IFTRKMHIEFEAFEVEATGRLEKVGRSFEITKIDMKSTITIKDETLRNKIERALELGDKYCFVANSMKCPREHEHEIVIK
ncbi:MAG: OsmC family protein, partial [Promethearchaeia archaeon]